MESEICVVCRDKISGDDRSSERRDGSKAVHHAGPVTQLLLCEVQCLLCSVRAVEDVGNRCRRAADDGAGEETEDDAEGDGCTLGFSQWPQGQDEQGTCDLGGGMHVQRAHFVGEVGKEQSSGSRGSVHDCKKPERLDRPVSLFFWCDATDTVSSAIALDCCPLQDTVSYCH